MGPGYLSLLETGELEKRAAALEERLASCDICPRKCRANRQEGNGGFCRCGYLPAVAATCPHYGEEPGISGSRGSGTVFFAGCNMRCVYCQNYQISQGWRHQDRWTTGFRELAGKLLRLQDEAGCHNINFVSPSHFVPQMVRTVLEAARMGLRLPIVYNSNGYDSVDTLKALDGIVDIYLPDLRYASGTWARRLSRAPDYVNVARQAVKEMWRQVGKVVPDHDGVARRGLIVRHLVLPDGVAGSRETLRFLAREVSPEVTVSLMSQYYPMHRAGKYPGLSRRISRQEYADVLREFNEAGLKKAWLQGLESSGSYLPDFQRVGSPFAVGATVQSEAISSSSSSSS